MEGKPAPASSATPAAPASTTPAGSFVELEGEIHYRISAFQRLEPFLISLASDTDLWMFTTSGGGLTAGRIDADGSLFPYRTVDQLHDAHHHTGPVTLIRILHGDSAPILWEPFTMASAESPLVERNLYKNVTGNRLVFEEINHDLGLAFRYCWSGCDEFGWVRSATLENLTPSPCQAMLLDGLRNILPYGVPLSLYQQASNLIDAYKKSEVDPETGLGIFSLTAGITDRAEALESLRASTVWCCGLEDFRVHLSLHALATFRQGQVLTGDRIRNGGRGHYLVSCSLDLAARSSVQWHLAGDTGRDHLQIAELRQLIRRAEKLPDRITTSLRQAGENLRRNVGGADGLQVEGRPESWSHHFANVLFNNLRGGVFVQNHDIPVADFTDFLRIRNKAVADRQRAVLAKLPQTLKVHRLRQLGRDTGDADFARLCYEYLPLYFGRRHGDPSRPWNRFAIHVRNRNGDRVLNYEGNWRDIFQNWEALCTAFPGFLPSVVAKFVNASTVDGFNPYRITRSGVDWETVAPDDPWSNIGYWGDHQIVYLLRLLEAWDNHDPAGIVKLLGAEIFSYADVPYRIKPYVEILQNSRATITFDTARAARIDERVAAQGTDGKLVTAVEGSVYHVSLLEKLLVPALAKLSNLVPATGIWMITQRPEWNDANNALGGGGVSVVTLCYLRRYLAFLADLITRTDATEWPISAEVAVWIEQIESVLQKEQHLLAAERLEPGARKRVMDALGECFSSYRRAVYDRGFSTRTALPTGRIQGLCRIALKFVDRSIAANRREDGLYHTYNLLEFTANGSGVEVIRLPEMLEGQVAVLSAGVLAPEAALELLSQLFASAMYRADQRSFMLYPEKHLPGFLVKNQIPPVRVEEIGLLRDLLAAGNPLLLARDADGKLRFPGDFRNAGDLAIALDCLGERSEWTAAVARDRAAILDLFEEVFRHKEYTGRSGVMYGYEGLGCIYWHMVAKLLLAVQENFLRAEHEGRPPAILKDLASMYFRIRSGIGYEKTVAEYGAFPTDPYSHTPAGGGAKQPGMTGQVKEEILTRRGELGIRVEAGTISFQPRLLRAEEFLEQPAEFQYFDVKGKAHVLALAPGSLAFTLCQVPVIYELVDGKDTIHVSFTDGWATEQIGNQLDAQLSADIFSRCDRVELIRVGVPKNLIAWQ